MLTRVHVCVCVCVTTGVCIDCDSRQTKLAVADRNRIVTTEDETRVVEPKALQDAIDGLVAAVHNGRAFVRYVPSPPVRLFNHRAHD